MQLKIISDGTTTGTYICHAETGERLAGVEMLSWHASAEQGFTEATIHLLGVPCEITSEAGIIMPSDVSAFPILPDEYKNITDSVIDISHLLRAKDD